MSDRYIPHRTASSASLVPLGGSAAPRRLQSPPPPPGPGSRPTAGGAPAIDSWASGLDAGGFELLGVLLQSELVPTAAGATAQPRPPAASREDVPSEAEPADGGDRVLFFGGGPAGGGPAGGGPAGGGPAGGGRGTAPASAPPWPPPPRPAPPTPSRRETGGGDAGSSLASPLQRSLAASRSAAAAHASPARFAPPTDALLGEPRKPRRRINRVPAKVLDAPALLDDFYASVVDWGAQNVVAVALGRDVYLWNGRTSEVTTLTQLPAGRTASAVAWADRGGHLAVADCNGGVALFDAETRQAVREYGDHTGRVGALAWAGPLLASGGKDRAIALRDARSPRASEAVLARAHKGDVCGLKWAPDWGTLASGGGDSKVGGLVWSVTTDELASVHGAPDNSLCLWRARSLSRIATLYGHTGRVIYLALAPDGESVVTGAGDESLRFWQIWPPAVNRGPQAPAFVDAQVFAVR